MELLSVLRTGGEVGMRLIDADALADALFEKRKNYPQWVADTIGAMPDAIVKCKDCKYGEQYMGEIKCTAHEETGYDPEPSHKLNWFCADGERKTDDA